MSKHGKVEVIHIMDGLTHTRMLMPKYNPYQVGHGKYKSIKDYDRKRMKRELRKDIQESY